MAKGYLSIEIAETSIRYLYIEKQGSVFHISKSGISEYQLDITDDSGLSNHLKSLLAEKEIVPLQIFLSLSRSETLIRQVTLPKMRVAKEIEGIIESEVEKVPAFADSTFDFIYAQYLSGETKTRVVFSALKQNVLDYIFGEIKKIAPFEHFSINPLNLKDLIPRATGDETRVLLVINQAASYFIIFKGDDYKLFYKTTLGMKNLSTVTGDFSENMLVGLTNEIQRVLKSYLSDNKEEVIAGMHVVYDQEKAKDLHVEIQKKLGVEMDVLQIGSLIDKKFEITDKEVGSNSIFSLVATPILTHLRGVKSQFHLDHFFREQQIKKVFIKALTYVGIFVLVYGIVMGMVIKGFNEKKQNVDWSIQEISDKRMILKEETKELFEKKQEYVDMREGLLSQATYVKLLNRVSWSKIFSVVSKEMPEGLSLSSFEFKSTGKVLFKGEALAVGSVSDLLRSVNASKTLTNGKFDFLTEKIDKKRSGKIYSFGIVAGLKKEILEKKKGAK